MSNEDGAKYELTAEYVENTLLGDEKSIRETVRQNRSLGEWVRDQIDKILVKLGNSEEQAAAQERRELRRIRDLYAKALRERSGNEKTAADSQRGGELRLPAEDEQYSIEELPDGRLCVNVNVDQHLFDGLTVSEMRRVAKQEIRNRFMGKLIGEKNQAYVNGRTAKEYTFPANKRLPQQILTDKLRASTELDNILDASTYIGNEQDNGKHPWVTGGLDRYETLFRVGNRLYSAETIIENTEKGPFFYDVTKIKEDITGRSYGLAPEGDAVTQDDVSTRNITQQKPEVKDLSLPMVGDAQAKAVESTEGPKDLSLPKVGDVQYSFASEEANTANNDLLDTAKDLETRGVSSEEIRRSTGWFRGMDGKWRFEIDDSGMSVKLPEYAFNRLRDLIRYEKYRVYAQLLYAMQLQRRSASAEAVCGRGSGQSRNGSFHQSLRAQGHKRNSACR